MFWSSVLAWYFCLNIAREDGFDLYAEKLLLDRYNCEAKIYWPNFMT